MRLFDSRLEVTEETFCKILSDCRGECDLEANENEENLESSLDSEEEEADFTALTNIWTISTLIRHHILEFMQSEAIQLFFSFYFKQDRRK